MAACARRPVTSWDAWGCRTPRDESPQPEQGTGPVDDATGPNRSPHDHDKFAGLDHMDMQQPYRFHCKLQDQPRPGTNKSSSVTIP
jgi:hypothetical protein